MNQTVIRHLRCDDILIGERRPVGDLAEMVASIRELGLLNPITVSEGNVLIAGRHRLEACRALGWERIPANVVRVDDLHAALAEIDENLIRNPPGALERAELWQRRKAIYEALHPEATAEAIRAAALAGSQPRAEINSARGDESPPAKVPSFTADAAAKTGVTPRTIRQEVQIADGIAPDVKEMIRDTPLADRKTDLLAIARTPGEQQRVEALARLGQAHRPHAAGETPAQKEQRLLAIVGDEDGNIARARLRQATSTAVHATYSLWALKPDAIIGVLDEAGRVSIREMIRDGRKWFDDMERLVGRGVHIVRGETGE